MKYILITLIVLIFIDGLNNSIRAQQVNTLYFMENVPARNYLNPAFQPTTDYYLSLPVIGFTQFNVGNNSLSLKDFVYSRNGQNITFLHPDGDISQFYSRLQPNTIIRTDFQTNLLAFGFKHAQTFWNFSLSERINGMVSIPRDVFRFILFGTPDATVNRYNLTSFQGDMTAYTEAALGFSTKQNEKLTVGAKLKVLLGNANISNTNQVASLYAGMDKWVLKVNGTANISTPVPVQISNNYQTISVTSPKNGIDWLKPAGLGAGVDLGMEYRLNEKISLSGAITDLGFIRWKKNPQNFNYTTDFTFDGVTQAIVNNSNYQYLTTKLTSGSYLADSLRDALQAANVTKRSYNKYYTGTTTKLNLGFEYSLLNNKLGLGLLSRTEFFKRTVTEEITASANFRPLSWINTSLSYSAFGGRMSSIGAGIGLKTGFIHWLVAADYIPFQIATISPSYLDPTYPTFKIKTPYNTQSFNLAIGMTIVFNSPKHKEGSGNAAGSPSYSKRHGLYKYTESDDCHCSPN